MSEITNILQQIEDGDNSKAELLPPLVYTELKHLVSTEIERHHARSALLVQSGCSGVCEGRVPGRDQPRIEVDDGPCGRSMRGVPL